jgi:phosphoglycolate phosphatase-like HAD superfamily hydrolase
VGFDLDGTARSQLEDIANAGNGHYFDAENYRDLSESFNRIAAIVNQDAKSARQEGNTEQTTAQQKIPIFDVLDASGHPVAQGQVGDTISGLVPGVYTLLIHREKPPITIENVIVNAGEVTVVKP